MSPVPSTDRPGDAPSPSSGLVDPETLFETRTVEEIALLSRGISRDVDSKREELRTMVGERYRDLMEAADTIARMKQGAKEVVQNVDAVAARGQELHARAISGFDSRPFRSPSVSSAADPNAPYLTVAAEVKLLMMSPEKMWAAVDSGDLLTAARIFLFCRHIHTGLTIPSSVEVDDEDAPLTPSVIVSRHFPVVSRQWASISHFRDAVLKGAERTMAELSHKMADGADKAVEAMAATLLLGGASSAEKVLEDFLELRRKAVVDRLKSDSTGGETAKGLACNCLGMMASTVEALHRAFVKDEEEEEVNTLKGVLDRASSPTMSLFQTDLSPVFKHLPAIVREFSPKPTSEGSVDLSLLRRSAADWLDRLHSSVSSAAAAALSHVGTVSALAAARRGCHEFLTSLHSGWPRVCSGVLGNELSLWDEFYKGVFRDRVEALVTSHVAGAVYCVQSTLSSGEGFATEQDLSAFLWSEGNLTEVEYSSKFGGGDAKSSYPPSKPSSLELKAYGYSPRVQDLCSQLDSLLGRLLDDLAPYVVPPPAKEEQSLLFHDVMEQDKKNEPFDLCSDAQSILSSAQDCSASHLRQMLEHVTERYLDKKEEEKEGEEEKGRRRGLMLFLGRFFQSLPELCPSLEKCVLAPQTLGRKREDEFPLVSSSSSMSVAEIQQRRRAAAAAARAGDPKWAEIKEGFERKSGEAFNCWIDSLVGDFRSSLCSSLSSWDSDPSALARVFPAWDSIEISEEGEDGQAVTSRIQVPQHPSLSLSAALAEYCGRAYAAAPHSLPPAAQAVLSQAPSKALCGVYKDVATSGSPLPQRLALQLHFDLQLASQCLISREHRSSATSASDECQSALSALEQHIDPFDLSVFAPHVSVRVKRAVLRLQGLIGVVIPQDRHAIMASIKSSLPPQPSAGEKQQQQEQHNVLWCLAHRPEKVPTVPIPRRKRDPSTASGAATTAAASVTPGGGNLLSASAASLTASSPRSGVGGRRRRDRSPVAKATGSFFEAMSTSWFGGKS